MRNKLLDSSIKKITKKGRKIYPEYEGSSNI
jgi:hypothetical protein